MGCQEMDLIQKICEFYDQISSLDNLRPSKNVDTLFTKLVQTCISPTPIDVTKLPKQIQEIRSNLIRLCGQAEAHLEAHFSTILSSFENPLDNLNIFPYYSNYLKLTHLEFTILTQHYPQVPSQIAFVGSGHLPLTSIVLALKHLPSTIFHNFDIDPSANSNAFQLISSSSGLSNRMFFHTTDILNVSSELKDFEVVFLAALVGMDKEGKVRVIDHLAKCMAPGAILMLRSAHNARAFLYPVVDPCDDLHGFEVLSVFHPTDEVINSVVIARKHHQITPILDNPTDHHLHHHQGLVSNLILPTKCSEIQAFNPLNHGNMVEELAIEEQLS